VLTTNDLKLPVNEARDGIKSRRQNSARALHSLLEVQERAPATFPAGALISIGAIRAPREQGTPIRPSRP